MKVLNKLLVQEFDLYRLVMINVILGIDQLSKNHVIIDCNRKKVYSAQGLMSGKQLQFMGEKAEHHNPLIISYDKATKYLHKISQGFLTSVAEMPKESQGG